MEPLLPLPPMARRKPIGMRASMASVSQAHTPTTTPRHSEGLFGGSGTNFCSYMRRPSAAHRCRRWLPPSLSCGYCFGKSRGGRRKSCSQHVTSRTCIAPRAQAVLAGMRQRVSDQRDGRLALAVADCGGQCRNERNHHDDHLPLCHRASRRSSQPQCLFPQLQAVCSAGCIGHIFVGTVVQDR